MTTHNLRLAAVFAVCAVVAITAVAQTPEQFKVQTAGTAKYGGLPVFPSCAAFAVERGDPNTGPSLLLAKVSTGCVVPWHWHTAREELMLVSGTGKIEMKDQAPHTLPKGSFVLLPGKEAHQFSCQSQCLFFVNIADTFDIHYVDPSGNEIPAAQAIQAVKEKPGVASQ